MTARAIYIFSKGNPCCRRWWKAILPSMKTRDILKQLDLDPKGTARMRFGRGVLGNTTYAFAAMIAGIVGVTWSLNANPGWALIADGGIIAIFFAYLVGSYIFAHNHPDMAMLGDTEWLQWSKDQAAARDAMIVVNDRSPVIGMGARVEQGDRDA